MVGARIILDVFMLGRMREVRVCAGVGDCSRRLVCRIEGACMILLWVTIRAMSVGSACGDRWLGMMLGFVGGCGVSIGHVA